MASHQWLIEAFDSKRHDREAFCCGEASLDAFIKQYASQNAKIGSSRTAVVVKPGENVVYGYYSVCAGSFSADEIPEEYQDRFPKRIPTVHLGRMAVRKDYQGHRLGSMLLLNCFHAAIHVSQTIGICAMDVVAKAQADNFYRKFGFISLQSDKRHLFLPMATVRQIVQAHTEESAKSAEQPQGS